MKTGIFNSRITAIIMVALITTIGTLSCEAQNRLPLHRLAAKTKVKKILISHGITLSGHGQMTSLEYGFGTVRNTFEGGVFFNNDFKLDGFQLSYKYYVVPCIYKFGFYFKVHSVFHLSSELTKEMNKKNHVENYEGEFEKFMTTEFYGGVGFHQKISENIFLEGGAGLGYYQRNLQSDFDNRTKDTGAAMEDSGFSVSFKLGIGVNF